MHQTRQECIAMEWRQLIWTPVGHTIRTGCLNLIMMEGGMKVFEGDHRWVRTATYIQSFSTGGVKMRTHFLRSTIQVSKFRLLFYLVLPSVSRCSMLTCCPAVILIKALFFFLVKNPGLAKWTASILRVLIAKEETKKKRTYLLTKMDPSSLEHLGFSFQGLVARRGRRTWNQRLNT